MPSFELIIQRLPFLRLLLPEVHLGLLRKLLGAMELILQLLQVSLSPPRLQNSGTLVCLQLSPDLIRYIGIARLPRSCRNYILCLSMFRFLGSSLGRVARDGGQFGIEGAWSLLQKIVEGL